jgi:hypothetical protein
VEGYKQEQTSTKNCCVSRTGANEKEEDSSHDYNIMRPVTRSIMMAKLEHRKPK